MEAVEIEYVCEYAHCHKEPVAVNTDHDYGLCDDHLPVHDAMPLKELQWLTTNLWGREVYN